MQQDIDKLLDEIAERLMPLGIEKLILFGSYAHGQPTEDSDLDLLVVTEDETMPRNYAEKAQLVLKVNRLVRDIKDRFPIDLIVHTHSMHQRFKKMDSAFCREIESKGKIVYEQDEP